jgi:Ca2+-binding RTX toxin-like protein
MIVNDDARAVNGTLDLITLTPGATSTFSGHGGVTTDGLGTNSTGTLQTDLPAGSTIVAAYLHVETRTFDLPFRPGQIGFGGQNVPLTFLGNVQDALPSSGINFETGFADVTSIVTSIVGAGPVGGLFNFTVDETITGNAGFVEGTSLTVIYSNASSPETTILVLHGGLTGPAINTTILNFASPLNPNAPGFNAEMALGIQYGYNGPGTANSPDIQYSMIDVNGARLTSSAGENDDSALASPFNGNLITVGGVGDNPANPTNANVHDLSLDDELYTLNGFIQNGTSALAIETVNPSDDDLIFLLTLSITGIASLSNGGSVLSILPAAAVGLEGNAGTTALTFTVVRDGDTTAAASVNYAVTGSGANPVAASDFSGVLPSGVVNFAIGETSKTITVNVSGDTVFEQDETFTVTLSGVSGALIGTGSAAGTIQNDDPEDDLLVSTPADQTLDGGDGNDTVTYSGIATPVTVSLALGGAQATGGGGLDTLISIENLIGGSAGDTLTGNAGVNSLAGGLGADTLIGAAGADALDGGGGIDTADYSSSGTRVRVNLSTGAALDADAQGDTFVSIENLRGSALNDILTGDGGANVLFGGAGNDQLSGLGGADILAGGAGIDALNGGDGVDAADYSASAARVRVNLATGAGLDADAQGDTLSNIEDLVGSAFNDILTGDAGANRLAGGAGADALDGAGGNDTADYSASTARVRVSLATGVALDAHAQGDTFANIENLIGSAFNDVLIGTAGVNVLSGGAGADTLDGGGDIDTADYSASAARVRVNLATGAGLDGDAQHDVLSNIENLIGSAFDDILTGSTIANALSGAAGADTLVGGLGADALNGGDGSDTADYSASAARVRISLATGVSLDADAQGDTFVSVENLTGTAFNDVLTGSDLANTLSGGAGNDQMSGLGANDVLIGGAGADAMNGGDGTDTADYSASATRVRVNLATGAGLDADASGDVLSNIENLTGSAFNDILTGTSGVNVLTGGAGADTLAGGASADTLNGGDGVDVADYSASASRVRVNLATGAALDADAQGDTLSSIESVIGSAFDDILTGNTLANALTGGAGADTLIGGLGADALNGGDGVDTVDYSASAARVRINLSTGAAVDADAAGDSLTAIENLIGTAFNDILTGSAVANALTGGAGNDQLSGLAGNDTMTGGAGADAFIFNAALDAATNIDTITDFSVINDVMWIENTFFTGLAAGALSAGAFQTGASATQADDRIIYNAATGALFFDADGNGAGAAVQFASLATGLALTNADFLVV